MVLRSLRQGYTSTLSTLTGLTNPADVASAALQETRGERLNRYQMNWAYYRNRMYDDDLRDEFEGKTDWRGGQQLYRLTRSLFNVCTHVGDIDAATILAPPVTVKSEGNESLNTALQELWRRSRLPTYIPRMLLFGSVYGDAFLRLANETTEPRIIVHSPTVMDVDVNPHDPEEIILAQLSYNFREGTATRKYDMIIERDRYRTFRDDLPYAYGDRPAEWPNTLGWVPVVPVRLIDIGEVYGGSSFQAVLPQLDSVNEIASQMAETVRIHSEPQIIAYGIKKGNLIKGDVTKGEAQIWYLNRPNSQSPEARVELLEWGGNVQGAVEFVDWTKRNVEEELPEYHLKRIRESGAPSGYSVELQLTEFQLKIGGMRGNAKEALKRIGAMAMVASGQASDIDDVPHDIEMGSIIPQDKEMEQRLAAADLAAGAIDRKEYLIKRGYPEEEIDDLLKRVDEEKQERAATFGLGAGGQWPPKGDQDANPEQDTEEEDED